VIALISTASLWCALPTQTISATRVVDHARSIHRRLVLIGDSIVHDLCDNLPNARCVTYPGAWVADLDGSNLTDQFITTAQLNRNDTVVLSSVGGFHSPGVDDAEILVRLNAVLARLVGIGAELVVLVAPSPNFPLCTQPVTAAGVALVGEYHDELCATGAAIAALERSWPVHTLEIDGPYVSDNMHQTAQAKAALAAEIEDATR